LSAVDLETLDIPTLSWLAGSAANAYLLDAIRAAGHPHLRISHGYVFQLLIDGPKTVGEIAKGLGFTQQAASKQVVELNALGYLDTIDDESDGRIRRVALSATARTAVTAARSARSELEKRLLKNMGPTALAATRSALANLLEIAGGIEAAKHRRVKPIVD
jgi:DNA-binding MarR family transcriptional regulator